DTDPIQIELAVRIAAAEPEGAAAGSERWEAVTVAHGHLFIVGDPKQSIYRFRRADIATFLEARARFGPAGGGTVELTTNFRTGKPIVEWINATFTRLMSVQTEIEMPVLSQPDYIPLVADRPRAPEGPAVAVIGREAWPDGTGADAMR